MFTGTSCQGQVTKRASRQKELTNYYFWFILKVNTTSLLFQWSIQKSLVAITCQMWQIFIRLEITCLKGWNGELLLAGESQLIDIFWLHEAFFKRWWGKNQDFMIIRLVNVNAQRCVEGAWRGVWKGAQRVCRGVHGGVHGGAQRCEEVCRGMHGGAQRYPQQPLI